MIRKKVCGLTRRTDVLLAEKLGVDALGFILASSTRQVTTERVCKLIEGISPFISRVAVTVNPEKEYLQKIVASGLFDYIQFHGNEDPALIASIPLKKIKAISIGDSRDLEKLAQYRQVVDYFLFDTRHGNKTGGTGKSFDWDLLSGANINQPFILAGGLGPDNLQQAIDHLRPDAVDLNSKIESSPGVKDHKLLEQVIEIIEQENLNNRNISGGIDDANRA